MKGRVIGQRGCFCVQKSKFESARVVWLGALPTLQVAYLRAIFGGDDARLQFGGDRTFFFAAVTIGQSNLRYVLVALECLGDTDARESHGSGKY